MVNSDGFLFYLHGRFDKVLGDCVVIHGQELLKSGVDLMKSGPLGVIMLCDLMWFGVDPREVTCLEGS
jgi:hypothetical protein